MSENVGLKEILSDAALHREHLRTITQSPALQNKCYHLIRNYQQRSALLSYSPKMAQPGKHGYQFASSGKVFQIYWVADKERWETSSGLLHRSFAYATEHDALIAKFKQDAKALEESIPSALTALEALEKEAQNE